MDAVNKLKHDPDWWREVRWNFTQRCKGWTLWQIYYNNPGYLQWIHDKFLFFPKHAEIKRAIDAAIAYKRQREEEDV